MAEAGYLSRLTCTAVKCRPQLEYADCRFCLRVVFSHARIPPPDGSLHVCVSAFLSRTG